MLKREVLGACIYSGCSSLQPPFQLYISIRDDVVGAALCQKDENQRPRAIYFYSKRLDAKQQVYPELEKYFILVAALGKFRHYLQDKVTDVYMKCNPIPFLLNKTLQTGRYTTWALMIQQFTLRVHSTVHRVLDPSQYLTDVPAQSIKPLQPLEPLLLYVTIIPSWYADIAQYLEHQTYPTHFTEHEKHLLCHQASSYVLLAGRLYHRDPMGILLRCVDESEIPDILYHCHDCGGHFSGLLTSKCILRAGYYWPKLFSDSQAYSQACFKCQKFMGQPSFHSNLYWHWALSQNGDLTLLAQFPL